MIDAEKMTQVLYDRFPGVNFYSSNGSLVWLSDDIPKPSDEEIAQWISEIEDPEDWDKLLKLSTPFVQKAQTTTNTNAFSLLMTTLTTIRTVLYLEMTLTQVRQGMKSPYTVKEIDSLNQVLKECNINLEVK
jgi:predicted PurR-regulated permease PerM